MARFLLRLVVNAVALWLTTLIVPGVHVVAFAPVGAAAGTPGGTLETILTYLLVALVFGIVNGVVGTLIRIVAFPLYVLTLGLVALLVNGLLLLIVAWISAPAGFGLVVDGFWTGVLGALVLAVLSFLIGVLVRPLTVGRDRGRDLSRARR